MSEKTDLPVYQLKKKKLSHVDFQKARRKPDA